MIETILNIWAQYGANSISTTTINYISFQAFLLTTAFILCLMPLIIRWFQLKRAQRIVLRELKTSGDAREARDAIKETVFRNTRWARGAFRTFVELWEETKLSHEDRSSTPVQLKEHLTPDIVFGSVGFQRIADALPGIFVAVGIFGTFYGLVLGLRGLDIEQVDQLQRGIGQLINGLSFAFITSLVGILLSVLFSFSHRLGLERIERNLLILNDYLEEVFPFQASEQFARNYSEVQNNIAHSLSYLAEDVSSKISYKIAPAFGEAVRVHLVPLLERMNEMLLENNESLKEQQLSMFNEFDKNIEKTNGMITDHFKEAQERQSEITEKILEKYVDNLNRTFKEQIKGLKGVIEDTTNVQNDIKLNIVNFNEQLQKQFTSQKDLIDKTKRAGEVLGETIEGFNSVSGHIKRATEDISKAAELMDSSAQKAMVGQEMLNKSIKTQMDNMLHTMDDLEGSWSTITENVESSINAVHSSVSAIGTRFDETIDGLLEKYDDKTNDIIGKFNSSLSEMSTKYSSITSMLGKLDEVFKLITTDISRQEDVLKEIRTLAGTKLTADIDKVVDISERLGGIAERISSESIKNKSWFDEMLRNMNSSGEGYELRNRNIIEEFSKLTDGIITKLNQSFSHFQSDGPLFTTVGEFNQNLKTLSDKIKGRDLDIIEPIVALNDTISHFTEHMNGNGKNGSSENTDDKLVKQMAAIEHQVNYISMELGESLLKVLGRISTSSDRMADTIKGLGEKTRDVSMGNVNAGTPKQKQPVQPIRHIENGVKRDAQKQPLSPVQVQNGLNNNQAAPKENLHRQELITNHKKSQPQPQTIQKPQTHQHQVHSQNQIESQKSKSFFRRFINR